MGAATAEAEAPAKPIPGQTDLITATFDDGPVGRLEKQAYEKDREVEKCEEDGDTEGADIARVEADGFREQIVEMKAALGEPEGGEGAPDSDVAAQARRGAEDGAVAAALSEDIIVAGLKIKPVNLGGKVATAGTLKLTGTKVKLEHGTFLKKGTVVQFSGTAVVNDVGAKDIHDSATQQVVDAVQNHSARITSLSVEVPQ